MNHKFKLKVLIYQRPFLRDDGLEYERYMGLDVLRSVFDEFKMRPDVKSLYLSFPEQWLNILEQRSLYTRLEHYCPNLETVTIKTHSVYIVQCTHAEDCGIVVIDDLIQESIEDKEEDLKRKLYVDNMGESNLINPSKLNIL